MNTFHLFRRTISRELRNASRDGVAQVGGTLGLLAGLALSGWGSWALAAQVRGWAAAGPEQLGWGLVTVLAAFWVGVAAWAGVGALRLGLASDAQQLLFTLPLTPAARWQALLIRVVREWVGLTSLLLGLGCIGVGLALALGPAGLAWATVAGAGALGALYLGPLASMAGAALLLRAPLPPAGPGALADVGGRCYEAVAMAQRGRDRAPVGRLLPLVGVLSRRLARRRTVAGALLWRGVLSQSRSWTFRMRALMTPVLCGAGLWLHGQVPLPWLSDVQLLAAFAVAVAFVTTVDSAPSPLGGEGERLALLLVAPVGPAELLRGKLAALLAATGAQALLVTVALGALLQLHVGAIALVAAQVAAALLGLCALFVGGSVFDIDLDQRVEGAMQALLVEEAPATPVRLLLVALGAGLAAAQIWLIVVLDGGVALIALVALTAPVVGISGVYGRLALLRVVR